MDMIGIIVVHREEMQGTIRIDRGLILDIVMLRQETLINLPLAHASHIVISFASLHLPTTQITLLHPLHRLALDTDILPTHILD